MTDNEATERLRIIMRSWSGPDADYNDALLDQALAWERRASGEEAIREDERRATVERIRAKVDRLPKPKGTGWAAEQAWHGRSLAIDRILREADR